MINRNLVEKMVLHSMSESEVMMKLSVIKPGYQFGIQLKNLEHGTVSRLAGLLMEGVVCIPGDDWPSMCVICEKDLANLPIHKVYTVNAESNWDLDWFAANLAKSDKSVKVVFLVDASDHWNPKLFYERMDGKIDAVSLLFSS